MISDKTIIRSKAPLRIGLAGGGTDVSPYSDNFGGAVLNITIDKYAYATLIPRDDEIINLKSYDLGINESLNTQSYLKVDNELSLLKGVYNRVVKDFELDPLSFDLITETDVPKGSGLGSSSTLTVAILGAFVEWLNLPLGEYDIAQLAHSIEREDLAMPGGKQDHYASTFGGVNFIEFEKSKVIVNPLRVRSRHLNELNYNLLLYYTGTSRVSQDIISSQIENFEKGKNDALEGAHKVKSIAYAMKDSLLTGNIDKIGDLLDLGWSNKKKMSNSISNSSIDNIYQIAKQNGATGGKISGAGGGGFFIIYAPAVSKHKIAEALKPYGGEFWTFNFSNKGLVKWRI